MDDRKRVYLGDGLQQTLDELCEVLRSYTPERRADVEAYMEHVALQLQAKKQASGVLDEAEALRLELSAREILQSLEGREFPDNRARDFFRLKLAAQVLREGFSQRVNPAFAALFSRVPPEKETIPPFRTNLTESGVQGEVSQDGSQAEDEPASGGG